MVNWQGEVPTEGSVASAVKRELEKEAKEQHKSEGEETTEPSLSLSLSTEIHWSAALFFSRQEKYAEEVSPSSLLKPSNLGANLPSLGSLDFKFG